MDACNDDAVMSRLLQAALARHTFASLAEYRVASGFAVSLRACGLVSLVTFTRAHGIARTCGCMHACTLGGPYPLVWHCCTCPSCTAVPARQPGVMCVAARTAGAQHHRYVFAVDMRAHVHTYMFASSHTVHKRMAAHMYVWTYACVNIRKLAWTCWCGHMRQVWTYACVNVSLRGHMQAWTYACVDICMPWHMLTWTVCVREIRINLGGTCLAFHFEFITPISYFACTLQHRNKYAFLFQNFPWLLGFIYLANSAINLWGASKGTLDIHPGSCPAFEATNTRCPPSLTSHP